MKNITHIFKFFLVAVFLITSVDAFAGLMHVRIEHYTAGKGRPKVKSEQIICLADKEAGYAEITFRRNVGVVRISLSDSYGNVVDEATLDTSNGNFVTLNIPDAQSSYTVEIEGDDYLGKGVI